ncbi:hypothetical protein SAV31267_056410 [Streptomyces avermitilis]|uniref:DUF4365 domain-containing protein n=2 Tax=Streptomyces TaxID=1883 RepID=A0A4D4MWU9_STRAX|nr:hypothetical protein SAVMC3_42930 [Streptomyces avermitilis]GDY76156.1 hypothetical protein SAV31267_056410 [Streptomyces avermitilis]
MLSTSAEVPAEPLRGDLREKDRMEMLQEGYLRAVAAASGCTMAKPEPDDGIDWQLTHSSDSHEVDCQIDLKIQLKSTWTSPASPSSGFVSVNLSNDRLEMMARTPVMVHRILVAMIVPKDIARWVEASHDYFALRHCAYWRSLSGEVPSGREHTAVRVTTSNIFDDVALCGIMERIGKGECHEFPELQGDRV